MKKQLHYFFLMLFAVTVSLSLSSCSGSDKDDEPEKYNDYFMTASLSGGGLSDMELNYLEAQINAELSEFYWGGIEESKAIYYFNQEVDDWEEEFAEGWSAIKSGTLNLKFSLVTKAGKTVKTRTLHITRTGLTN